MGVNLFSHFQEWMVLSKSLNNVFFFYCFLLSVANIDGIYTAGSGLESTCLVFGHGLDLYWTRVTPSKMFDVLKEDFDYWFILGTLGILVLVTIVSQRLASIKMLRQAWQWEETPPNYSMHCLMVEALIPAYWCTFAGWCENDLSKYKYHKINFRPYSGHIVGHHS